MQPKRRKGVIEVENMTEYSNTSEFDVSSIPKSSLKALADMLFAKYSNEVLGIDNASEKLAG